MTSMFWGLRLEPGKRYSTTVGKSFHVSMAALDCATVKNENDINSVMLEETESRVPFILCTLQKHKHLQCPLDLNFMTGDRITFFCKGNGTIHLTGYVHEDVPDEDEYGNLLGEEEEEEEEEEDEDAEEEEDEEEGETLSKGKKQLQANGLSGKRRIEGPSKAGKKAKLETYGEDDSEDDDDDEDIDEDDLMGLKASDDEDDDDEEDVDDDEDESQEEVSSPAQQKQQQKNKGAQLNKSEKQSQNGVQQSKKEKKKEAAKQKNEAAQKQQKDKPEVAQKKSLQGGVQIKDIKVGTGNVCKPGQKATVYYVGRLKDNNKVFDSTKKGNGFTFTVGKGEVIKAWDVGVAGMKVGGKRTIICPPNMAYGQRGSPPTIPPNSSLVFEVELRHTK